MAKLCLLLSFFSILVLSLPVSGQNVSMSAMQFTEEDGIANEMILCIAQDKEGFVWFGGRGGLGRFDGSKAIIYYPSPGDSNALPAEVVYSMCITTDEKVCAGTEFGGLAVLNQATQQFTSFRNNPLDSNSISGNTVFGICEVSGFLWAITESPHLNRIEVKTKKVKRIPLPENLLTGKHSGIFQYTNCIFADTFNKNRLWITSQAGLWSYDIVSGLWNLFRPSLDNSTDAFTSRWGGLFMESSNILWVGNSHYGLLSFNIDSGTWHKTNNYDAAEKKHWYVFPRVILPFDEKHLVFPEDGAIDSLFIVDKETSSMKKVQLNVSNKSQLSFQQPKTGIKDRDGNIWIGSYKTLSKITDRNDFFQFESFKFPVGAISKHNHQRCILDSVGSRYFYAGSSSGYGLLIVDKNDFRTQAINYKSAYTSKEYDVTINDMLYGSDRIWIASSDGLLYYIAGAHRLKPLTWNNDTVIRTPLTSILFDKTKNLWLGTRDHGISVLNIATREKKEIRHEAGNQNSLCSDNIRKFVRINEDEIWIATQTGISVYNETTKQFSNITQSFNGMPAIDNLQVFDIEKDEQDNIWFSSLTSGMFKLEMKNSKPVKAKNIQMRNGFPSNQCGPIQKDKNGFLWIATMKGIVRLDARNETFVVFNKKDGLSFLARGGGVLEKIDDGRILIGASRGMEWFYPENLSPEFNAPKPYFVSLRVNENRFAQDLILSAASAINLKHAQNDLQFEFGALNMSGNHEVKFMFQLENYDKRWIDNGSMQMVRYTNLSPGDYTFKVKAGNSYGGWSKETALLSFSVLAPWWETGWFISLSVIAAAFIIWLVYSYRLRQIKKMYAVRAKISSDLHDDIGSTLTSIRHYSEMAKQQSGSSVPAVKQILDKIGENAGDMIHSMSDIIWAVNPKYDDLVTLRERMENFAAEILSPKEILYAFNFDARAGQLKLSMEKRKNIFLIYKEALNNAAKYSGCKNVMIHFVHQGKLLMLQIQDDGSGFDEQTVRRGNGLSNMSSRVKELKGKIKIDTSPGKGTNIELEIPI